MSIAIRVENVSKVYQIGQIGTGTLSRDIERWWVTRVMRKEDPFLKLGETNYRDVKGDTDVVWSLKDIDLDIEQGDAIGIIGSNGAGKSTLLKLLSRVTGPSTGRIKIKGRVASLLEVGTGFHPELTGRENIYLNGSILGMRKKEIDRKFDEIVDFSGVERYIDTPVKRYSSGMSVRLAFAVAAHLESEILIVDEVLAVGDAEFQNKCIGKMGEVGKRDGRTVLFVSHNMGAVQELCRRGIQIDHGHKVFEGEIGACIANYCNIRRDTEPSLDLGSGPVKLRRIQVNGTITPTIESGEAFDVSLELSSDMSEILLMFLIVENSQGASIVHSVKNPKYLEHGALTGRLLLNLELPPLWLSPGIYTVHMKFITRFPRRRFLSERVLLKVTGQYDKTGKTLLTPEVTWSIGRESVEPMAIPLLEASENIA